MSNFQRIKNNIDELFKLIESLEIEVKESPNDFSLSLKMSSYKNQLEDLQQQLYQENLKREKEIIKIRLIGNSASYGTLPLNIVGGITTNFSLSIHNTSKYIQFGKKGGKKRNQIIKETIDLRLENIGRGSTIFYVSGKTSPDLFGESILQNSLENTFNFFNSTTPDQVTDNIVNVGGKSLKYISKFLKELTDDNLECDLKWDSPDNKEYFWNGKKEKILSLYNTINKIEISEPQEIEFEGELITISAKGKFEIETIDKKRLFGTFSIDLLEKMKEFHIRDYCRGIITKTTIYNPLTDKEKVEYNLTHIE
ncbi:hypothetical protein [Tenacibaculum sp. SDUM215027]|uniref:hypothetical protein n=1 Tax=Tenacibaculum sp. SDUM215027 TaxID=3422596 RepID=UPI003D31D6B2